MTGLHQANISSLQDKGSIEPSYNPSQDLERFKSLERIASGRLVLKKGRYDNSPINGVLQEALNYVKSNGAVTSVSKSDTHLIAQGYLVTDKDFQTKTEIRVREYQQQIRARGTLIDGKLMGVDAEVGTQMRKALLADIERIASQKQIASLKHHPTQPVEKSLSAIRVNDLVEKSSFISGTVVVPKKGAGQKLSDVVVRTEPAVEASKKVVAKSHIGLPIKLTPIDDLGPTLPQKADLAVVHSRDYLNTSELQQTLFRKYGKEASAALANPESGFRKFIDGAGPRGLQSALKHYDRKGKLDLTVDGTLGPSSKLVMGYAQFKESQLMTIGGRAIVVDGRPGTQTYTLAAEANREFGRQLAAKISQEFGVALDRYDVRPNLQQENAFEIVMNSKGGVPQHPETLKPIDYADGVGPKDIAWLKSQIGKKYSTKGVRQGWNCMSLPQEFTERTTGVKAEYDRKGERRLDIFMLKYANDIGQITSKGSGLVLHSTIPENIKVGSFVGVGRDYRYTDNNRDIRHGGVITNRILGSKGQIVDYEMVHASSARGKVVKTTLSKYLSNVKDLRDPDGGYLTHQKAFVGEVHQTDAGYAARTGDERSNRNR